MSELSEGSSSGFTDNGDNLLNYDELSAALRSQKDQQFNCLIKLDSQFNAANIAQINQHQDTEFNEVMANVEILINYCLRNVHKNDGLICLSNSSFFNNPSQIFNNLSKNKKAPNPKDSFPDFINFDIKNDDANKPITIDSFIQLDFIRNGLHSGPLPQSSQGPQGPQLAHEATNLTNTSSNEQKSTGTQSVAFPALSRSNTQGNISLASQLNYKFLVGNKNYVVFKYLLVMDLSDEYFDCRLINDKESIYSIKSKKKPPNWTRYDYDQFTVDIQSTTKEPLKRIFSNIINSKSNEAKRTAFKLNPTRYLNSKAIFDRLFRQFYRTIIKEWSTLEMQNLKFSTEDRSCEIKDNQLKVCLRYKGARIKDLDVVVYLNLAIKYNDEVIENRIVDSMVNISNNFLQNGGFFIKPPVLDRKNMLLVIDWMNKVLKINLSSIYLVPNCIHHWTLNILPLKMNFLVWLIWLNSFGPKTVGTDILFGLFAGEDRSTNAQIKLLVASHLSNKGSVMKQNDCLSLILNNNLNSNLFLLVKLLQLFNYLSLSKYDISIKMENHNSSEEELISDLIFLEMNHNSCFVLRQKAKLNASEIWSSENLFDRFWSCLFKLRSALLVEHILPDPFRVFRNSLPYVFIKHITLQFYSVIPLTSRNCKSSIVFSSFSNLNDIELRNCVENAMRLLFVNIINDDTKEIKTMSQTKLQPVILSDISVKRQNTVLANANISMMTTVGSNPEKID